VLNWFLKAFLVSLAFILTLAYIRFVGVLARRIVSKSTISQLGVLKIVLLYTAPTILTGSFLLAARLWIGLMWISETAIVLSLTLDFLVLSSLAFYHIEIKQLLTNPGSFAPVVKLDEFAEWPESKVVIRLLKYIFLKIPFLRKWLSGSFSIAPGDFKKRLKSDIRWIDKIPGERVAGMDSVTMRALPHLFLPEPEPSAEKIDDLQKAISKALPLLMRDLLGGSNHHVINRGLNAGLSDELWAASCFLCCNPPLIIAKTWKQYHRQESLRLRLIMLFNTAELLQRLIGSIVLSRLREIRQLPSATRMGDSIRPPNNMSQWRETLEWALATSNDPGLLLYKQILLHSRNDLDPLNNLEIFRNVLGETMYRISSASHTLGGFRILSELRNKIIGHGGVGWQLNARPIAYLTCLHQYFLKVIREIPLLNLSVSSVRGHTNPVVVGQNRGLEVEGDFQIDCNPACSLPESGLVMLNPYLRFHDSRLLVFNRYIHNKAEYIDYNSSNIAKPSYRSFVEDMTSFLEP